MDVKQFTLKNGTTLDVKDAVARTAIAALQDDLEAMQAESNGFEEYTLDSGSSIDGLTLKKGDVLTVEFVSVSGRDDVPSLVVYGTQSRQENYTTLFSGGISLGESKSLTLTQDFPLMIISCWPIANGTVLTVRVKLVREESAAALMGIGDQVCRIFKKVVCVGDSYTAGYIQLESNTDYAQNPTWAWPYFAGLITGQQWLNYGISGATSISWQTNSGGLAQVQQVTGVQAYVVWLGINDILRATELGLKLGTIEDIGGSDTTSYYRNMGALIEALHSICDKAKILVNTIPATDHHAIPPQQYDSASYNQALRAIVAHYKSLDYPIHCIDLASDDNIVYYQNTDLMQDYKYLHYTPIGYEQMAEIYLKILSRYILDNVADFQDVFLIPTSS